MRVCHICGRELDSLREGDDHISFETHASEPRDVSVCQACVYDIQSQLETRLAYQYA